MLSFNNKMQMAWICERVELDLGTDSRQNKKIVNPV